MIIWSRRNIAISFFAFVVLTWLSASPSYANWQGPFGGSSGGSVGGSWGSSGGSWGSSGSAGSRGGSVGLVPVGAVARYQGGFGLPAVAQNGFVPVRLPMLPRTPDVAPPPGTLGRTYIKTSRRVPWDKHPRTAMVEIEVDETVLSSVPQDLQLKISVQDVNEYLGPLNGFRGDDGKWHFESEPLLPGVPHIHRCNFEVVRLTTKVERLYGQRIETQSEEKIRDLGTRTIRLISGRIVDLKFGASFSPSTGDSSGQAGHSQGPQR